MKVVKNPILTVPMIPSTNEKEAIAVALVKLERKPSSFGKQLYLAVVVTKKAW